MQRRIDLEGCLNFRDLGGYPTRAGRRVRWRRLFRSDGLHLLTAADIRRLRDELGLAEVIDLRSTAELASEGRGMLAAEPLRFHHLPLFDGELRERRAEVAEITLADRYTLMAELAADRIGAVITRLAYAGGPAVFHCAAGKDRTGVISAILLALLDVPDEVIVADYAATQDNLDAIVERLMSLDGYRRMLETLPPETLHAKPETMLTLLERLTARFGSAADYVRHAGVSDEAVARLRATMIE
ncbi:MAG TPA: tyrosine-protein phosphatase [Candidatus Limnocylindria bacterium]|nr:tyrosine-protein phosphatase [Candidatus Limnocylindria bacterium]